MIRSVDVGENFIHINTDLPLKSNGSDNMFIKTTIKASTVAAHVDITDDSLKTSLQAIQLEVGQKYMLYNMKCNLTINCKLIERLIVVKRATDSCRRPFNSKVSSNQDNLTKILDVAMPLTSSSAD